MLCAMLSFMLLSLQLLLPPRKPQVLFLVPILGQQIFYSLPGARGAQQLWMYIIISPLQQQTIAGAVRTPGYALDVGVNRKLRSHLSDCCSVGVDFIPLVAETLGGLAKDSIRIIQAIGKALGKRTNPDDPSVSTKHLFGQLAIALWRGNACCWLHHSPFIHPSLDGQT